MIVPDKKQSLTPIVPDKKTVLSLTKKTVLPLPTKKQSSTNLSSSSSPDEVSIAPGKWYCFNVFNAGTNADID